MSTKIGNVTGGPSSINLSDLHDVSISAPQDGQVLRYNTGISEWQNVFLESTLFTYIESSIVGEDGIIVTPTLGPDTLTLSLDNITPTSLNTATAAITNLTLNTAANGTAISLTNNSIISGPLTGAAQSRVRLVTSSSNSETLITAVPNGTTSNGSGLEAYQSSTVTSSAYGTFNISSTELSIQSLKTGAASLLPITIGVNGSAIDIDTSNNVSLSGTLSVTGSISASNFSGSSTGTNTGDQTITLSGDLSGTGGGAILTTLATVNASPQTNTFRKITVNAKGLVTATSAVVAGDITTSLGYTPVNKAGDTMSGLLILSADPVVALGAATKQYVDSFLTGIGSGNVVGPASAVDSNFVQFDGITGKLIKGGLALTTSTTLAGNSDTNVPSEKAVKAYADSVVTNRVVGPVSSVDSNFVQFDGTTGKLVKGGLSLTTTVAGTSNTNIPTEGAVKAYADGVVTSGAITTALGYTPAASLNPTFTGSIYTNGPVRNNQNVMGALDVDCSLGNVFTKTIAGASVFTFSNPPASGNEYTFKLFLTHTSGAVTWPLSVSWPSSTAPTLTTGKLHIFFFTTYNGGTNWYGASLINY